MSFGGVRHGKKTRQMKYSSHTDHRCGGGSDGPEAARSVSRAFESASKVVNFLCHAVGEVIGSYMHTLSHR